MNTSNSSRHRSGEPSVNKAFAKARPVLDLLLHHLATHAFYLSTLDAS